MPSYLTELAMFHERMAGDPSSGMPATWMSLARIHFAIVISLRSGVVGIEDLRDEEGKPRKMLVPAAVKRGSNILPNLLWDNAAYVLGVSGKRDVARTQKCRRAFVRAHKTLFRECDDPGVREFLHFLGHVTSSVEYQEDDPDVLFIKELPVSTPPFLKNVVPGLDLALPEDVSAQDLETANFVFRIDGRKNFLHEEPVVREIVSSAVSGRAGGKPGECLVTGKTGPIARIHPAVKGVYGTQGSGAALVSFNCPSFTSYGKKQCFNAPVSEDAAHAYVSALNWLLDSANGRMLRLGDTSIVFWTEAPDAMERSFGKFLSPEGESEAGEKKRPSEDTALAENIRRVLMALRGGTPPDGICAVVPGTDPGTRFFVLGLAPNAARISVRFWFESTVGDFLSRIGAWYNDLAIEHRFPEREPEFPPLWMLACSLSASGKTADVPPAIFGGLARSLLSGCPLPAAVLPLALGRIRARKSVDYLRAQLLKAWLVRNGKREVVRKMDSLDQECGDAGYLLGRAFAIMEKVQKDALGQVNSSVKDCYFDAASTTPARVFPLLVRLNGHHARRIGRRRGRGLMTYWEKRLGDVLGRVREIPVSLSGEDQALFMLGYYHQNNDLYRKKAGDGGENA